MITHVILCVFGNIRGDEMKVKCILCDRIDSIDSGTLLAKNLRKKRVMSYMCDDCNKRIKEKTEQRIATGNFRVYREKKKDTYI